MTPTAPTPRTTVARLRERGVYERAAIDRVLDEGLICHIGFVSDGQPYVIPTAYARAGDVLYMHGSPASRMLGTLAAGVPCCVTVTLLDSLVLARSAFHHCMNYRSVVVLGTARAVTGAAEKDSAFRALVDHIVPGRWDEIRPPNAKEIAGTTILALPLDEASAKMRTGPPVDDEADYGLDVWAGELPLPVVAAPPVRDPALGPAIAAPGYVTRYRRP